MEPLIIKGEFAQATVYAAQVEATALQQLYALCNSPAFADQTIAIMPDVHAGAGCVIGFTATLGDAIPPALVGVDVGCGVLAVRLPDRHIRFEDFDAFLRRNVPSGHTNREQVYPRQSLHRLYAGPLSDLALRTDGQRPGPFDEFEAAVNELVGRIGADRDKVWKAVGSLGQGNHFGELDVAEQPGSDNDGTMWLTLHSGSRNFGLRVANHHQKVAQAAMGKRNGLEYLTGEDAQQYLRDMHVAQRYAALNRLVMADALMGFFGDALNEQWLIHSVHNFIGADNVVRKGAISARQGDDVIIPWNMAKGLVVGKGLGNAAWNNSAPHGAGRLMGRGEAKRTLSVDDFKATMAEAGVWSSCVGQSTLDEAPAAYKPSDEIEAAIGDTVRVEFRMHPVYNFKASDE